MTSTALLRPPVNTLIPIEMGLNTCSDCARWVLFFLNIIDFTFGAACAASLPRPAIALCRPSCRS